MSGAIQGGTIALFGARGFFPVMSDRSATISGGGFGSGFGTLVTEGLSNLLDRTPEQQVSAKEIAISVGASIITGAVASTFTAGFNAMLKEGGNLGASVISTKAGDMIADISFNAGQKKLIETVFGASDDYLGYVLSDILMSIGEMHYAHVL